MKITRGKIPSALKVVLYGVEGIGKSTFAAQFPDPVFIDTEGSTKEMDVARFDAPASWTMLKEQIRYIITNPSCCGTLVIDTADWAERMEIMELCAENRWKSLETPGYGKGYQVASEEFGRMLDLLTDVVKKGVNVVITAHAKMRKFEQPDELGAYDRWELKLSRQTGPLLKEWADMVLFANYKTYVVTTDNQGKKHKAQGGKRVMHTTHHPCWDAKNRHGLADELPFDYSQIAHCIPETATSVPPSAPIQTPPPEPPQTPVQAPEQEPVPQLVEEPRTEYENPLAPPMSADVPPALVELMTARMVTEEEVREVIAETGYFPGETPWQVMQAQGFIDGWVIPNFDYIVQTIEADPNRLPF